MCTYTVCITCASVCITHRYTGDMWCDMCVCPRVSTTSVSYSSAWVKNIKQTRCLRYDRAVATMSSFEDKCCLETLTAIVDDIETDINNVIIDGSNVYKYCLLISCNVIIGG